MIATAAVFIMTTHISAQSVMLLTSTSFSDKGDIPSAHTCEGDGQSFALNFSGVPATAKSLALVLHDPDAPDPKAPRPEGWTHWVLYDLPPTTTGLAAGVTALPPGTHQGKNDWKKSGFRGPCPAAGKHRYVTTLYALDTVLPDLKEPTRDALLKAMDGHIVATAELVGVYAKKKAQR